MKYTLTVLTLMVSLNSFAALSPYWDQVRQLEAVIESNEVSNQLQGQKIIEIKVLERGLIQVSSSDCQVTVTLEAHSPNHPGATAYTVQSVTAPVCK